MAAAASAGISQPDNAMNREGLASLSARVAVLAMALS
jgi:hypothetical protein